MVDRLLLQPLDGAPETDILSESVCNQLQIHAMEAYPNECLGYIKDGEYVRLNNNSNDPDVSASLSMQDTKELLDLDIDALCHSHPEGPDCPSALDMQTQMAMAIPFVIVSTTKEACKKPFIWADKGMAKPPLVGRPFRHGVWDCYDLVRSYYLHVRGVFLEDAPRGWDWWSPAQQPGEGLYEQNFRKWGFEVVHDGIEIGDVVLLKAGSKVVNHAGVYIGDHLLLHHLAGRLEADKSRVSTIEPIVRWQQGGRMDKVVRYVGGKNA